MKFEINNIEKRITRKNKIRNTIIILLYIIIIPIILYNLILIIQSFINKDEIPDFFGYKSFIIVSGSMQPNLNIGDIIVIKETDINDIREGDIISFREGSAVITHRVNKKIENNGKIFFQTKGDNNNVEDKNLVIYDQIEGKYYCKIQKLGNIALILKNKIIFLVVFLLLFILYYHNVRKEEKRLIRLQKRKQYEEETKKNDIGD